MYAELRITAEYGDAQQFAQKLRHEIGPNLVPQAALTNTALQPNSSLPMPNVIAIEQIQQKALIYYLGEGRDTIVAHVEARTVAEVKQQTIRVARRVPGLFEKTDADAKTNAVIYAVNWQGFDTPIISGKQIGRWKRFFDALSERWIARIVTPGVVFAISAAFLPGSSSYSSAAIGLIAAMATIAIEGALVIWKTDDWKWEEVKDVE
jgi:hypothetical protein